MSERPASNARLCELDREPLGPRADEALRRIGAFLYGVNLPRVQGYALLAGYDPHIHRMGAWAASWLAGERSFEEWRLAWAQKPRVDPDLPAELAALDAVVAEWHPRVLAAAATVPDAGERAEIEDYVGSNLERASRTWRASAWVGRVEQLAKVPLGSYRATWRVLVGAGIEAALRRAHALLDTVRGHLLRAPLGAPELAAMHAARERLATDVERWLEERRRQLGHLSEDTLRLLALGAPVPPPLPEGVTLAHVSELTVAAKA
ncbi:MAG: hypothetical protein HY908_12730 [Myxococcales bacterium]|nr:hypothetical protein [Myxococcales bacterium]